MNKKQPFEEVYLEHYDKVYKAVYMRILEREDAEDIVQEVFIKAMNAYERYDPEKASVQVWLNSIAINALYDFFRKGRNVTVISFEEFVNSEVGGPDPELEKLTDGVAREAYQILKPLKDEERELLMLRFAMELSYKEIAEKTESNEKAIAKRIERILEKSRKNFL